MADYEDARQYSAPVMWGALVFSCVFIIGWGVFCWLTIPDVPRQWNLGDLPDVPGQSIYSSDPTPLQFPGAQQQAPLPEARPRDAGSPP